MSKRRLKNRKLLTEINVIPYVDISLVLLVIFMVATPFMIQGIDLDLPHFGDHPIPMIGFFESLQALADDLSPSWKFV